MSESNKINRREFIRRAAVSGAGLAAAASGVNFAAAKPTSQDVAYIRFLTQETDAAQVKQHRLNIKNFEAQNPNIRVELQLTGAEQIVERMVASLSAGVSALDVLQPNPATAFAVAAKGLLLPIDDVVKDVGGDEFFYGNSVMKLKDQRYGVPFGGGTVMLWYRKDLFEADGIKVPTTWEELEAAAKHFTKKFNAKSPTEIGISLLYSKHAATCFNGIPFLWSNGGDLFDKDLNIAFDSDATAEFLDWYGKMFEYTAPAATGWAWADLINTFLSGQSAMTVYLGRVLSRVYANAPQLVGKVGAFPYPKRKLLITQDDPNYLVINGKTEQPDAAKKWVKFLVSGQAANDFLCTVPGHLPPATKAEETWWNQDTTGCKMLDENKDLKKVIGESVNYAYFPVVNAGGVIEAVKQGKDRFVRTGVANPMEMIPQISALTVSAAIQEMVVNKKSPKDAIKAVMPELEQGVAQMKKEIGWGS
ncbi:MAG: sugar ABC transporter substrate-binding protein [Anaerolineae bacterium]|nr:sugar ABC transporter substrate-binding protein [Anaerolineae bacterium]